MIGLALDAGSSAAGRAFSSWVVQANRLLAELGAREYFTPSVDIVVSLRVSGEITDFGIDGCDRLRKDAKRRRLSIDVGIPMVKWQNASADQVKRLIAQSLWEGVELCAGRVRNENGQVEGSDLHRDLRNVFARLGVNGAIP